MAIGHPLWMAPATQMTSPMGAYACLCFPDLAPGREAIVFCQTCPSHPKTWGPKPAIKAVPHGCPLPTCLHSYPLTERGPALLHPLSCQSIESAPILGRAMNFSSKACRLWETHN